MSGDWRRTTCANRLTIRREEVERRVLIALKQKLLARELFEEFCREFTREMNRLRMEERARQSALQRELTRVDRDIRKLIDAIKNDMPLAPIKVELIALDRRKAELTRLLEQAKEVPPLLHPGMADLYRSKVNELCQALEQEDARPRAAEAIRSLLDEIVLEPDGSQLRIIVQGNLAAMLRAAQNEKRPSAEADDLERTVTLVARARYQRYRTLARLAS